MSDTGDAELRARLSELAEVELAPMVPGWRTLLPQIVISGILPVVAYALLRPHVPSDAIGLMIVSVFPVAQIAWDRFHHGRRDPISILILIAILLGVVLGLTLNGNTLLLKIRQSAFTGLFGVACLVSMVFPRPLMFWLGREFASGGDPQKRAAFSARWHLPTMPRRFRTVTLVWAIGLMAETTAQVLMALGLSTQTFLVLNQIVSGAFLGSLLAYSVFATRRGERYAEALLEQLGGALPPAGLPAVA
ncbi:MAG TPA: VC0807 family protein [Mycobacteriales bacterium]